MYYLMMWSRRFPIIVILLILSVTGYAAFNMLKLKIDASASGMMIKGDPAIKYYEETIEKFGTDNITIIYIKDKQLFTPEKLAKLDEVNFKLEEIKCVEKVESLFSVTNFKGVNGELSTAPLMDYVPETLKEAGQIKKDALRNPVLVNNIISTDGTATALNVYINPDKNDPDFLVKYSDQIEKLVKSMEPHFEQIFEIGNSYTKRSVSKSILTDQVTLVPISIAVLLCMLIIFMRSKSGAILPIITAGTSVIWTSGFMGYMGIPLNILTVIVPSLIIVIGSTEDMHLLSEYVEGINKKRGRRDRAIQYMASKTGTAVLITALTTFLGFLSIIINDITILKQFGMAAAFGLFVNPIITAMLAPVYLYYFGPKYKTHKKENVGLMDKVIKFIAEIIIKIINSGKWVVLAIIIIVTLGVSSYIYKVKVNNDFIGYFKPSSEIRTRADILHNEIAGSQVFYIRIDSGTNAFFKRPKSLQQLEKLQRYIEEKGWFDKTSSIADYIKLIHREMNDGDSDFHQVPYSKKLIAQYLITLQRDEISRLVTTDYSSANIVVRHNKAASYELNKIAKEIKIYIARNMNPHFKSDLTGENIIINAAADSMTIGQFQSLSLLVLIIFIIMSVLFINIKAGLLSLIPNFFPVLLLFGVMGILEIPLNVGTAMVAAIAIGIAVDDTVHFMTRYNKEMRNLQDQKLAMEVCIRSEIKPVLSTSISLALGFSVVCLSTFVPVIYFGFLSALVMLFALVGDLFLTPIILTSTQLISIWDMLLLDLKDGVIKKSELFASMRLWQLKRVVLLSRVHEIKEGQTAIYYGDHGNSMFVLLEGKAEIVFPFGDGNEQVLSEVRPGDVFGEMAMIQPGPRTADVRAVKNMKYLEVTWQGMRRIKNIYPRIAASLYKNISNILVNRLKDTTQQLMDANK